MHLRNANPSMLAYATTMATYLDSILEFHRRRATQDPRPLDDLVAEAKEQPPTRGFAAALRESPTLAVISEIKRRSPSKGDLNADLDAAEVAQAYETGGAAALSVLTDEPHFGGSVVDLQTARGAVQLPVIRKDFTVAAVDVCDARIMGADCVLLIAAALSDGELNEFSALASELGLDALIEVHDEAEVQRALTHGVGNLVGVNQRDLVTFSVDQERAVRVAKEIPTSHVRVAESGVRGHDDAVALEAAGYDAVLVGEHLVTAADPSAALNALRVPRT